MGQVTLRNFSFEGSQRIQQLHWVVFVRLESPWHDILLVLSQSGTVVIDSAVGADKALLDLDRVSAGSHAQNIAVLKSLFAAVTLI